MPAPKSKRQQLSELIAPDAIILPSPGRTEREILEDLLEVLEHSGKLDSASAALEAMLAHRCCSFVRVAPDVVVVHTKLKGLHELTLAVAISLSRVTCQCLGPDVSHFRILFLVLNPFDEPSGYLRTLTALYRMLGDTAVVDRLCALRDPEAVWRVFESHDNELPDYISAADIMRTEFHVLHDTDSLSRAIDAFCEYELSELPVIDQDGDLVGVVSEDELLRICLPEYVTWTEDLSAILDFEPFVEVLRREEKMPVMEIMLFAERYAAVEEGTPAIQVAKIMMRDDIRQVLVTRNNRLVGLISLSDFIRKVLRA